MMLGGGLRKRVLDSGRVNKSMGIIYKVVKWCYNNIVERKQLSKL